MSRILEKLYASLALGAALALGVIIWYHGYRISHADYWGPFFTFLHVISGITWMRKGPTVAMPVPSDTVISMLPEVPTSLSWGVPESSPVASLKVAQSGLLTTL